MNQIQEQQRRKKSYFGELNGEGVSIPAPKWDCSWYVGFGYLQNNGLHTHLDSVLKEHNSNQNTFDGIKEVFGSSLTARLKDENTLWKFCDLINSYWVLKEAYEIYHRGGSHYSQPNTDLTDEAMSLRIMEDLFKVVNEICDILNLEGLEFNEEIKKDIRLSVNPSHFHKNPRFGNENAPEWVLDYVNPYDNIDEFKPKEYVLPKKVLQEYIKKGGFKK